VALEGAKRAYLALYLKEISSRTATVITVAIRIRIVDNREIETLKEQIGIKPLDSIYLKTYIYLSNASILSS
jgi:hypothetical protein